MARSNSPGYPNLSLPKAIAAVEKIWNADRTNPVDRVTAAKHIGYAGQSGASDKALASLAHYGLTEKTGKGEVRVSRMAMDIVCPDPEDDSAKIRAVREAAMRPQVFADLRARFPGHVSEDSLRNYLIREGFNNIAIPPVMNAFFDTFRFLEQFKDVESRGPSDDPGGESDLQDNDAGDEMQEAGVLGRQTTIRAAAPAPVAAAAGETEWMRSPLGRDKAVRLLVTGKMGSKDIGKLIKLLEAQKAVLDDDDEDYFDELLQ